MDEPSTYHEEEWGASLPCGSCGEPFVEGQAFAHWLVGFLNNRPEVILVCIKCDVEAAFTS